MNIVILGLAGAGKTATAASLAKWSAKRMKCTMAIINMDPGADKLPYKPAFDVRDVVTVEKMMKTERLGPNGAMLRSMDVMLMNSAKIAASINAIRSDINVIDTPGQMEMFVFHDAYKLLAALRKPTVAVFLLPGDMAGTPRDLAIAQLVAAATRFRVGIPMINAVSKSDKLSKTELTAVSDMMLNPSKLAKKIQARGSGMDASLAAELVRACNDILKPQRVIMVSAKTGSGIEGLYHAAHELLCSCGDTS